MTDFVDILKTVAPGIATALGGPLAGLAVSAIGKALNLSDATQDTIKAAVAGATPEDMLKLKEAEQDFQVQMKKLDIDLVQIAAGDRDSARKMQIANKAWTPAVLSWLIVSSLPIQL